MTSRLALARLSFLSTTSPAHLFKTTHFNRSAIRAMSTAKTYEFLVVVPDKPGAEIRKKRLQVRHIHFSNLKAFVDSGSYQMGGALLNSIPNDDEPTSLDFMGSTLVCTAESVQGVREQLSRDIYATSGVWDMDKVQIYPFRCAFRTAKDP